MSEIEVDPVALAALGRALSEVAGDVAWQAAGAAEQAWALGPGESAGALASVLGDFEHQRLRLGRELDDLAAGVDGASRLYVDADAVVGAAVGTTGGPGREPGPEPGAEPGAEPGQPR